MGARMELSVIGAFPIMIFSLSSANEKWRIIWLIHLKAATKRLQNIPADYSTAIFSFNSTRDGTARIK